MMMNVNLKRGFTLPEVCIALLVFSFGMLALARFAGGVRNVMLLERQRAEQVIQAAQTMERLIASPPPCDSLAGAVHHDSSVANYTAFLKHVNLVNVVIEVDFVQINRWVKCK